jgi:hypothetical protein
MPRTVTEAHNACAGLGAVLLDIGGDIGALVVEMPASLVGLEVEVRPIDGIRDHGSGHLAHEHLAHQHLAHVAVVARPVADGHLPSLVFPELPSGRYELFEKGRPGAVALSVEVEGGRVTSASWPIGPES